MENPVLVSDELNAEVREEFDEASAVNEGTQHQLIEKLEDYTDRSPAIAGGDIDAAWDQSDVGEELIGGGNPTPDQDIVDDLGKAYGVTYDDNEPLDLMDKLERRDRWELDPASADDFDRLQ